MGYQMRTVQKINKTRSRSVKHVYLPLPAKKPDIVLHPKYVVIIGQIDYHTGKYKWRREFSFNFRKYAEKTRDMYFDYMWIPNKNGLIINTVAIVVRYRG